MRGKWRFNKRSIRKLSTVAGMILLAGNVLAGSPESPDEFQLLPPASQQWLSEQGMVDRGDYSGVQAQQLRQAERRVFDFIERGTGRLVREPERAEDRLAVARHLALLAEVLAEPVFITSDPAQVGFIHGPRFGSGTIPVDLGDGEVVFQCVSMRDHLLGRTSPSAFPGFIRWIEE